LLVHSKSAHLFSIPNDRRLSKTTIVTIFFLNMNVLIETNRLLLRTFTTDDAGLIYELNKDPEVTRYTHDPVTDIDHARQVLEKTILPQYALYNHGRWAVHIKQGLTFIGWCGLKYRPELNEVDLGYRFSRLSWGKGYATESAFASIQYGFERLDLTRIVGRAEPGNIGSWRVLEKCGMHYIGEQWIEGHITKTYEAIHPSVR
jgi:[ribosomal protein S5]-alanine N-acetyltransferase